MASKYEAVDCLFNDQISVSCFCADKHSESPDSTSAWCCWTSLDWTENVSLPQCHQRSCSSTSTASCWMKRNKRGWSSTEISVTNLIKLYGCQSDTPICITNTREGKEKHPDSRYRAILRRKGGQEVSSLCLNVITIQH